MARAAVPAARTASASKCTAIRITRVSDGAQSMFPEQFDQLMAELRIIAPAIGRSICVEPASRRGWGR